MTGDEQFDGNIKAIAGFTVGIIVCAFAFELVGRGPAVIPSYTARVDYWSAMSSNGRDHCPGPLPKGVAFTNVTK
jgi:hypothetical protein